SSESDERQIRLKTDLQRFGLALLGAAVAVAVGGVLLRVHRQESHPSRLMRNRGSRRNLEGWLRRKTAAAPPVPKPARPPAGQDGLGLRTQATVTDIRAPSAPASAFSPPSRARPSPAPTPLLRHLAWDR